MALNVAGFVHLKSMVEFLQERAKTVPQVQVPKNQITLTGLFYFEVPFAAAR